MSHYSIKNTDDIQKQNVTKITSEIAKDLPDVAKELHEVAKVIPEVAKDIPKEELKILTKKNDKIIIYQKKKILLTDIYSCLIPYNLDLKLINFLVSKSKASTYLNGLKIDYSDVNNKGISLPLSDNWIQFINSNSIYKNHKDKINNICKKNSRHINIVEDKNYIIGFDFFDNLPLWSINEVAELLKLIASYYYLISLEYHNFMIESEYLLEHQLDIKYIPKLIKYILENASSSKHLKKIAPYYENPCGLRLPYIENMITDTIYNYVFSKNNITPSLDMFRYIYFKIEAANIIGFKFEKISTWKKEEIYELHNLYNSFLIDLKINKEIKKKSIN